MKKWLLAVAGLAGMTAALWAQDVKSGTEKVAFEKKSYPYEGEVTVERLNVRMFPKNDQTSIITSVLGLGEKVTVLAEKDEYYQILPPKGSTVWVASRNIKRDGDQGVATAGDVPVRLDSRVNAEVLCTLKEGDAVKVVGDHMGWLKIEAPAAVKYFVGKKYVHTSKEVAEVSAAPVSAPKKDGAGKKPEVAAAEGSDVEARELIATANLELKRQDELLNQKKFDQLDFSSVVSGFQAAKTKAQTDAVRAEADRGLERYAAINRLWEPIKIQLEEHKRADEAALAERLKAEASKPKFTFHGYIDSTGVLFKRPGTHKLVVGGRIVCFLRSKDGDDKMLGLFNNNYQKLVGVNGVVIKDPEGWTGYSVVVVDQITPLEKE